MALQILGTGPDPEEICAKMQAAIGEALPGAEIQVEARGPGHYEIRVVSEAFRGKGRVQQQQLVYGAITPFMQGTQAPVHAVDKLECVLPD